MRRSPNRGKAPPRSAVVVGPVFAAALVGLATIGRSGDYVPLQTRYVANNAQPAIDALVRGDFAQFLALHPWMGSFSLLLRWPFAALGEALGSGNLFTYKVGSLPCLLALGILAVVVDRLLVRRGRGLLARLVVAALLLLNPAMFNALLLGHPEELLAAALCAGAVLAGLGSRWVLAGLLLGLAVATKQWAVVAALPVLVATPTRRLATAAVAGAVAVAFALPLLVGNPDRARELSREMRRPAPVGAANIWIPFGKPSGTTIFDGVSHRPGPDHAPLPRPVILLLPFLAGLLLIARRLPHREDALGLLALVLFLRCIVDPINLTYYYLPFLTAACVWESLRRRDPPVFALLATFLVWVTLEHMPSRTALSIVWAAWALPIVVGMACALVAPRLAARASSSPAR